MWRLVLTVALLWSCREPVDPVTSTSGVGGAGGSGGAPLPDPQPLTVLNWNLHNFVNAELDDPIASQEEVDPAWSTHRAAVGAILRGLDPDIAVLQEVEHQHVLDELNDLELDNRYVVVHVVDGNDPRGIDIGVLSKLPVGHVASHKDDVFAASTDPGTTYQYSRDCVEVHLLYNGRPLAFLGVHFRAKSDDDPQKRLAEAEHTRAIADGILAAAPATAIAILGDFNDLPGSPAYVATVGVAPDVYENAADHVPEADRWTFDFNGSLELVDHQMTNPRLSGLIDAASVRILHDAETAAASDHSPIFARYLVH